MAIAGAGALRNNSISPAKRSRIVLSPLLTQQEVDKVNNFTTFIHYQPSRMIKTSPSLSSPSSHSFQESKTVVEAAMPVAQNMYQDGLQSTSPSSNSYSQTSISSHSVDTPSTAVSSVRFSNKSISTSPEDNETKMSERIIAGTQLSPVSPFRSRSSSVISVDTVTRSSGRNRKPTAKAQVLAEAGTNFYRSLRQTTETTLPEDKDGTEQPALNGVEHPSLLTREQSVEPDNIVDSVEAAPPRHSPRQRKPTAKASESGSSHAVHSRTSPSYSIRSVKNTQPLSVVPGKPSKLRYSLPSSEDEKMEQSEDDTTAPGGGDVNGTIADSSCHLACLTPSARLLAFARYAAEAPDSDDDQSDDDETDKLIHAAAENRESSRTILSKIALASCSCRGDKVADSSMDDGQHLSDSHELQDMVSQPLCQPEEFAVPQALPPISASTPAPNSRNKKGKISTKSKKGSSIIQPDLRSASMLAQKREAASSSNSKSTSGSSNTKSTLLLGKRTFEQRMQEDYAAQQKLQQSEMSRSNPLIQGPEREDIGSVEQADGISEPLSMDRRSKRQRKAPISYAVEPLPEDEILPKRSKKLKVPRKSSEQKPAPVLVAPGPSLDGAETRTGSTQQL